MSKQSWEIYSASWSQPQYERDAALAALTTEDVTYTDPMTDITGRAAFSDYMGEFQKQFPGTRFEIIDVREHHGQSLANWRLTDDSGAIHMLGTSHARMTSAGKFLSFTGFF